MSDIFQLFLTCTVAKWAPRWGDTDAVGIALTSGYVLTTVTVLLAARQSPNQADRRLWWGAALFLLLLTVNKQLDLQSYITIVGRCMAKGEGWYAHRFAVQKLVTYGVIAVVGALILFVLAFLRRLIHGNSLLLAGLLLLTGFIIIRMISFHHMDQLLRTEVFSIRLHRLIEGGALSVVLLAALLRLRRG